MLKSVKVCDYMTTKLITFSPETSIAEAIKVLIKSNISGAPVVNESNQLLGILSEGDCLKSVLAGSYHEEMGGNVSDFMTTQVEVIDAEADIIKVSEIFIKQRRRRLPVIRNGELVGQISRRDVLRAVNEFNLIIA